MARSELVVSDMRELNRDKLTDSVVVFYIELLPRAIDLSESYLLLDSNSEAILGRSA